MELERKASYAYIMANSCNSVVYVGVTTNLANRVWQHKNRAFRGFICRCHCNKLVYFEAFGHIREAVKREKQLKAGDTRLSAYLIAQVNPEWKDLSLGWLF